MHEATEAASCQVWPENWPVLQLFLAVCGQWRSAALGGAVGLDYTAVDVVIRYRRLEVTPEQFEALQHMEQVVLKVWADKRDRASGFPGKR